tara:strand:- start:91 stop:294 length:204 start_codon:yes stop_codon:yes gene_type:complete
MYNQNHKTILNQVGKLREKIDTEISNLEDLKKEASGISRLVSDELFFKINKIDLKTDTILENTKRKF